MGKETIHSILKMSEVRFLSHGDSEFFLCPTHLSHLSLFLYRAQNLLSLLFYFKTVYILHNRDLRRMHAHDPRRSFRVDVFDSKEDYQYNFDETLKVEK